MKFNWLILSLMTSTLFGLPIGNPSEPVLMSSTDQMTLRIGYCNDTVGNLELVGQEDWSQEARWMTNAGQLTLNVLGKVDLFGTLGVSSLKTRPTTLLEALPQNNNANACVSVKTFPAATYGYGVRATLFQFSGLYIGLESQVLQSTPRPFFSTTKKQSKSAEAEPLVFKQKQVGLAASYSIPVTILIVPYAGIRYRHVTLDFDELHAPSSLGSSGVLNNLKEKSPWGSVLGMALVGRSRWSVGVEGNVRSQPSLSAMAQIKY